MEHHLCSGSVANIRDGSGLVECRKHFLIVAFVKSCCVTYVLYEAMYSPVHSLVQLVIAELMQAQL
jgi:hypothetical protein